MLSLCTIIKKPSLKPSSVKTIPNRRKAQNSAHKADPQSMMK